MKVSEKKRTELYAAIADPMTDQRIFLQKHSPSREVVDNQLFKLQNDIWRRIHKALNIEGPA